MVVAKMTDTIKKEGVLLRFDLVEDGEVLCGLIELITGSGPHIAQFSLFALLMAVQVVVEGLQLLFSLLMQLGSLVVLTVNLLLLVADLHQLERCCFEVLLKLAHISALFEESLRGRAELVLKDLLALKIGTFSTALELVAIVLVAHL